MQTFSPLYEDIYHLCEKTINETINSNKPIHARTFYNTYRGLHKFNRWFGNVLENDFEKLFKAFYFDENISIEKWEHRHYWYTFVLFQEALQRTEHLLKMVQKLRLGVDAHGNLMDLNSEEHKEYRWVVEYENVAGKFDEVSMTLHRNAVVMREDSLEKMQIEYDFTKNRLQISEASKIVLNNMIALENCMSCYLCEHTRMEDLIYN